MTTNNGSTIRDELEELILLKNPFIVIGEHVPFGINQIVNLNEKLGSVQRIKGSLLTNVIDEEPTTTTFQSDSNYSTVWVEKFDLTRYVKFSAQVRFPEDNEIEQDEEFGVLVHEDGTIIYGGDLMSVQNKDTVHNPVSVDILTRVLGDLIEDSSLLIETILSNFQNQILEIMYNRHEKERNKFSVIFAEEYILPKKGGKMPAKDFQDGEDYENELNQVFKEFLKAMDLPDGGSIFLGSEGLILVSWNHTRYQKLIGNFLTVAGLDLFLNNFFNKIWVLFDTCEHIRSTILGLVEMNAKLISMIQGKLSDVFSDIVILNSIIPYLKNSIISIAARLKEEESDEVLRSVTEFLNVKESFANLEKRSSDIDNLMHALQREVTGVQEIFNSLSERQMRKLTEMTQESIRSLENIAKTSDRQSVTLDIIELILAGSVAFDLIGTLFAEAGPALIVLMGLSGIFPTVEIQTMVGNMIIFIIGGALWVLVAYVLFKFLKFLENKMSKFLRVNMKINGTCNIQSLRKYLSERDIDIMETKEDVSTSTRILEWEEDWGPNTVSFKMQYDEKNNFLENVICEIVNPKKINRRKVINTVMLDLVNRGVVPRREMDELL